jgi:hypothetical protein
MSKSSKRASAKLTVVRVATEAANDAGFKQGYSSSAAPSFVIDGMRWRIAGHRGTGSESVIVLEAARGGGQMHITHEAFLRALNGLK